MEEVMEVSNPSNMIDEKALQYNTWYAHDQLEC